MLKVAHRVQAHPARALMAKQLADEIGGDVAYDPDPDFWIKSPWRTYEHLIETAPADATHIAAIQDDAVVCKRYREAVDLVVAAKPDRILCLFVGGRPNPHSLAVLNACRNDRLWAELAIGPWLPVVCTVWPAQVARDMVAWNQAQDWTPRFVSDDERAGRYIQAANIRALASVPSLAEHPDMVDSLLGTMARGGTDDGRVAACWIGACSECDDPTTLDWASDPWG